MMIVKVVDRHGPVIGAWVVVTEHMPKWLRRLKEQNRVDTSPMRGRTDSKGCVYMNVHYECKAEIAVDGVIYGNFLLDTSGTITIKIRD